MKNRANGFLIDIFDDRKYAEVADYIIELHELLWRFTRTEFPWASGSIDKYVDCALESAEARVVDKVLK